VIKTTVSNTHL